MGPDFAASRAIRNGRVAQRIGKDLPQYVTCSSVQTLDYPASFRVNRIASWQGQLASRWIKSAGPFSRCDVLQPVVAPNFWARPSNGHRLPRWQVQVPQPRMTTLEDLRVGSPVTGRRLTAESPFLGDVAHIEKRHECR
jgi:hypothetical protein